MTRKEKEREKKKTFELFFNAFFVLEKKNSKSASFHHFLFRVFSSSFSLSSLSPPVMTPPSPYDSPRLSAAHPPWPGAFDAPPTKAASVSLAFPRAGTAQQQQQQQLSRPPPSRKGLPLASASASLPSFQQRPSTSSPSKIPLPPPMSSMEQQPPRSARGWSSSSSSQGEKKKSFQFSNLLPAAF